MDKYKELEERISQVERRNTSVEKNKAWETSYTRRLLLVIFTYLAIVTYLFFIVHINPWINAIVPAIGFMLSTLSLPFFKKLWEKYIYKKLE
jgi:hypothetical protein